MELIEGNYWGVLVSGVTCLSQSKKSPQIMVTFSITHADDGNGGWTQIQPTERNIYLSLTDAARPYSEDKLEALGFNGDFANPGFSQDATTKGVGLLCKREIYNGKDREKWDLASWGVKETELAPSDIVRMLNAQWRQRKQQAAPAGKPGVPTSPPAAAPRAAQSAPANTPSGDDIPF